MDHSKRVAIAAAAGIAALVVVFWQNVEEETIQDTSSEAVREENLLVETILAHAGCEKTDPTTGALTPAIHMSSTFERDPDLTYSKSYVYTRLNNPTRDLYEKALARTEGGLECATFSSGSAAAAAIFQALTPADYVIIPDDLYHGNREMLKTVFEKNWRLEFCSVNMQSEVELKKALEKARTSKDKVIIWTETPSNPMLKITDLAMVSRIAGVFDALHICDATWLTPIICRPLEFGCDLVLHSSTKYIGGHSDLLGGAVICGETLKGRSLFQSVRKIQGSLGAVPSPFDCWLSLRGLRSLYARMRLHCDNALEVAKYLSTHPAVEAVYYPGLESGHAMYRDGLYGGMLSFLVRGGKFATVAVAAKVRLIKRATSLGGTESLIEHRASIEPDDSATPQNLLRMSVGLEHPKDIIDDLKQALGGISA